MKDAARTQIAIQLLTELQTTDVPIDRLLSKWGRENRYAGSKDRRAIQDLIYLVLRHRGEILHALRNESSARLEVFAALRLFRDASLDDLHTLATGAIHQPAELSESEQSVLADLRALEEASLAARHNIPDWLAHAFERAYGEDWPVQASALGQQAAIDIRVNALKTTPERVMKALAESNIVVEPLPNSFNALRAHPPAAITHSKAFNKGMCEVQDVGSQMVCLLADPKPGEQVIDLCAGAGGKSLALGAMMNNTGQIYAMDINENRLMRGKERVERAGLRNTQFHCLTPFSPEEEETLPEMVGEADLVFVDAPCSGSGAWRRHPEARWHLTPALLSHYQALQREVLERGARYTAVGGRLVYVTCSLFKEENEDQVEAFLAEHADFTLLPWTDAWPAREPLPETAHTDMFRVSPANDGCDGFFAAFMVRTDLT